MPPTNVPVELTLGHRFVLITSTEESEAPEEAEAALENVVPMSGQYQWLAEMSANPGLQMDPGAVTANNTYAVAPFVAFINSLLGGLVDSGVNYTGALYLQDHVLKDGQWIRGGGHIFKLMADGSPVVQEANIGGDAFEVEILISVTVIP